jgi:hypothetical protein
VVNAKGQLEGILSMDDIILHSEIATGEVATDLPGKELALRAGCRGDDARLPKR